MPAMRGGILYAYFSGGGIEAVDAETGRSLWGRPIESAARKAKLLAGENIVLCCTDRDELLAMRAKDGEIAWRRSIPGSWASSFAMGKDAVYLAGGMAALKLADGSMLRRADMYGWTCAPPTALRGSVLAVLRDGGGTLSAFDSKKREIDGILGKIGRTCDGAIVSAGRIYLVADCRLMAIAGR